jgi:outer membrane receptor protein involved in Fe transport
VRRDLGGGLYARAAAYSGFRPPTLNELYRPFRVGNDITEANAGLEPERLYGIEAGLGGGEGPVRWNATVFANRLADPVTNVTIGAGPGVFPDFPGAGFVPAGGVLRQRRNAGAIEAWGVEAEAERAFGDRLRLRLAAGYTSAEVDGGEAAPQLTGLRPAQTPQLTITAGAQWRPLDRFELGAALRYESARFEDDLNTRELDPALTVDVRAAWRLTPALSLYVAADNLFDAAVQTGLTADGVASYDAPRVVRAGVSFRR